MVSSAVVSSWGPPALITHHRVPPTNQTTRPLFPNPSPPKQSILSVGLKDTPAAEALTATYDPKRDFNHYVGKLPVRMDKEAVRQYSSGSSSSGSNGSSGGSSELAMLAGLPVGFAASGLLARRGAVFGGAAAAGRRWWGSGRGLAGWAAAAVAVGSGGGLRHRAFEPHAGSRCDCSSLDEWSSSSEAAVVQAAVEGDGSGGNAAAVVGGVSSSVVVGAAGCLQPSNS